MTHQPTDDARRFLPLSTQQFHILLSLIGHDRHGYGIILEVAKRTADGLRLGTGTLYTAIGRLATLGLITETDKEDDRRRYYRLTTTGRAVVQAETERLEALVRYAHREGVPARRPAPLRTRS